MKPMMTLTNVWTPPNLKNNLPFLAWIRRTEEAGRLDTRSDFVNQRVLKASKIRSQIVCRFNVIALNPIQLDWVSSSVVQKSSQLKQLECEQERKVPRNCATLCPHLLDCRTGELLTMGDGQL